MQKPELSRAIEIVRQAAAALNEIYADQNKLEIVLKADNTPVTNADLLANEIIVSQLRMYFPDIPIISEEEAPISFEERSSWSRYWLIDPLDGTAQFIKRTGEFSINLALIENNQAVMGVVSVPAKNLVYYATKGSKAYKQITGEAPQEISVMAFKHTEPLIIMVGHALNVSPRVLEMLAKLNIKYSLAKYGSSLKICLIAEGLAHLYPRLEKNCEWDTAAGQCILIAAGGQMIDLENMSELRYNTKDSLVSQEFVACALNLDHVISGLGAKVISSL